VKCPPHHWCAEELLKSRGAPTGGVFLEVHLTCVDCEREYPVQTFKKYQQAREPVRAGVVKQSHADNVD